MPLGPSLIEIRRNGKKPFVMSLPSSLIADQNYLDELDAVEDVLMVGYPIGLWDQENNLPIARRGITASMPSRAFDGDPQFLIDCACFPGSSGSPVFLYNPGSYRMKSDANTLYAGSRLKLLGVLWGGPQYTAQGKIVARPVPMNVSSVVTQIPMNLGYCVRADQIWAFTKIIDDLVSANTR